MVYLWGRPTAEKIALKKLIHASSRCILRYLWLSLCTLPVFLVSKLLKLALAHGTKHIQSTYNWI